MNSLSSDKEWALIELADDTMLGGDPDIVACGIIIQKNLNRVKE